jgi:hypothetical protein
MEVGMLVVVRIEMGIMKAIWRRVYEYLENGLKLQVSEYQL